MKILTILIALLICCSVQAEDKKKKDSPINITADKIEYRKKENCILLQDNIKVVWDETTLIADKAMLYQSPNSTEYDKVVAAGNIKLVSPERVVTGQKAVWVRAKNEITITGSPHVREKDGAVVTSAVIRYNTETKKVTLQGKPGIRNRIIIDDTSVRKLNNR
jgi:lipopolysaccharide transport protein LptA